jgi:GxxExxY protein
VEREDEKSVGFNDCSPRVIGACIEVHRALGPGLLESAYEQCLAYELGARRLSFEKQLAVPVRFKGVALECGYRVDFLVERALVLEVKAVERLLPVHEAQVLTYLKLLGVETGLLVNFHSATIKRGLRRLTLKSPSHLPPSCKSPSA